MQTSDMFEAYVAITSLKARYCRTLDAKDWDGFASCFDEDLLLQVPGAEPIRGREQALDFIRSCLANARTVHQVHLPEFSFDGDEAQVIWAMQDRNTWDPPRNGVATQRGYGQYHERYVRTPDGWKIASQRLEYLQLDINVDLPPA